MNKHILDLLKSEKVIWLAIIFYCLIFAGNGHINTPILLWFILSILLTELSDVFSFVVLGSILSFFYLVISMTIDQFKHRYLVIVSLISLIISVFYVVFRSFTTSNWYKGPWLIYPALFFLVFSIVSIINILRLKT